MERSVNYADVSDRELAAFPEPLTDPHVELRPMACLALALGLAAEDSALRGQAQEGLIAAVQDGRSGLDQLSAAMARLLDTGINKLARWAKSLREVARVSPAHTRAAASVLQSALRGDPTRAPRDVSALLELFVELLSEIDEPLRDPSTRQYLAGLPAGGKTARLARQLLALALNPRSPKPGRSSE